LQNDYGNAKTRQLNVYNNCSVTQRNDEIIYSANAREGGKLMKKRIAKGIVSSIILATTCLYTIPVFATTKDETVYSKMNSKNEYYSTVVSAKLENSDEADVIEDISNLLNIENTNGDETFTQDGTKLVWQADGNNIYYQGDSEEELPVTCEVTYELDGEEISADEIAGKKGNVKVTLKYTNHSYEVVKVNGKYEKMYTPFIIVAGTSIDNSVNRNIKVSMGKTIDNATKTIVVGMAFPGLQESLDVSKDTIDIPDSIEISMDAEEFEMNTIMSCATPKFVEVDDLEILDNLDEIYEKANALKSATTQLVQGAEKLNNGASQLDDGLDSLLSGATELSDGADQLNSGATKLSNGTSSALSGLKLLNSSVKSTTKSLTSDTSDALKAEQIKSIGDSAASQAVSSIKSKESDITDKTESSVESNADEIYEAAMASAKQIAEATATSTAESVAKQTASETAYATAKQVAQETAYTAAKTAAEETAVYTTAKITADANSTDVQTVLKNMSSSEKASIVAMADSLLDEDEIKENALSEVEKKESSIKSTAASNASLTDSQKSTIKAAADEGVDAKKSQIQAAALESAKQIATTTALTTAETVAKEVGSQVGQSVAEQVANQVKSAALKQVANNMSALTDGLDELEDGLTSLDSGASNLQSGTSSLADGSDALKDGVQQLSDGTSSLEEGTKTYLEGVKEFDADGISKICDYINGDLKDLEERVRVLKDLADKYNTFSGLNEGDEGTVKFITVIDAIKYEEDTTDDTKQAEEVDANETTQPESNEVTTSGE